MLAHLLEDCIRRSLLFLFTGRAGVLFILFQNSLTYDPSNDKLSSRADPNGPGLIIKDDQTDRK